LRDTMQTISMDATSVKLGSEGSCEALSKRAAPLEAWKVA
jgi:hypothetical protein